MSQDQSPKSPAFAQTGTTASFIRRLAALVYDLLLGISFVFIVAMFITGGLSSLDIAPVANTWQADLMFVVWLGIGFLFFGWFWTHGGQTLGLRAWKLRIVDFSGHEIRWSQAFKRYVFSLAGFGYLWMLFDQDGLALQDRLSESIVVKIEKP